MVLTGLIRYAEHTVQVGRLQIGGTTFSGLWLTFAFAMHISWWGNQTIIKLRRKPDKNEKGRNFSLEKKLAHQLFGNFQVRRKRTISESRSGDMPTQVMHWPTILEKKRKCKLCTKKYSRRESKTGCEQCGINLCITCFKQYHLENFPQFNY